MFNKPQIDDLDAINVLGPAFLGLQLYQLLVLIDQQGGKLVQKHKIKAPPRVASFLMFLKINGPAPVTGIGKFLGMSHQLVAHRVKILKDLGLIKTVRAPEDGRKTLIMLTPTGQSEAKKLENLCQITEDIYGEVFKEIGVDLYEAVIAMKHNMAKTPLAERYEKKLNK